MSKVFLGVGSNIDREKNIQSGLISLAGILSSMSISPIYESHAVGFEGDNFFNFVIGADTHLSVRDLAVELREIEFLHGREPDAVKFSARSLDIDILLYDDLVGDHGGVKLPREEITLSAHVLLPLADLYPNGINPISKKTFLELVDEVDFPDQTLWKIEKKFKIDFS